MSTKKFIWESNHAVVAEETTIALRSVFTRDDPWESSATDHRRTSINSEWCYGRVEIVRHNTRNNMHTPRGCRSSQRKKKYNSKPER